MAGLVPAAVLGDRGALGGDLAERAREALGIARELDRGSIREEFPLT